MTISHFQVILSKLHPACARRVVRFTPEAAKAARAPTATVACTTGPRIEAYGWMCINKSFDTIIDHLNRTWFCVKETAFAESWINKEPLARLCHVLALETRSYTQSGGSKQSPNQNKKRCFFARIICCTSSFNQPSHRSWMVLLAIFSHFTHALQQLQSNHRTHLVPLTGEMVHFHQR